MILVPILLLHLAGFHYFSLMQKFPSCEFTGTYLYFLLLDIWIASSLETNTNDATVNIVYSTFACVPVGYTPTCAIAES